MVAPTAKLPTQDQPADGPAVPDRAVDQGDDFLLRDADAMVLDQPPVQTESQAAGRILHMETRRVPIPPHRMSPLRALWPQIYPPLVEHLLLQVRVRQKVVELRTSRQTKSRDSLQKGEDFIRAIAMGFDLKDAIALLRMDDLYIESFEIKDVRTLHGDSLSRAISRIAGTGGKMKHAIENATTSRVVLAGQKIHILGRFDDIRMAREAVVSLVLGSRPGKVYQDLRTMATRKKERC